MIYPDPLEVIITHKHLNLPAGRDVFRAAVIDALDLAGLPHSKGVTIGKDKLWIYHTHSLGHDASYFIPDDAWKLAARHANAMRVKPGVFEFPLIYQRGQY